MGKFEIFAHTHECRRRVETEAADEGESHHRWMGKHNFRKRYVCTPEKRRTIGERKT